MWKSTVQKTSNTAKYCCCRRDWLSEISAQICVGEEDLGWVFKRIHCVQMQHMISYKWRLTNLMRSCQSLFRSELSPLQPGVRGKVSPLHPSHRWKMNLSWRTYLSKDELHHVGRSEISDWNGDTNNFWLFAFHVSLWGFQILNGGHFTGDIANLIHAIIIVY